MLRRKTSKTRQARDIARLFAALDAAGSERRAALPPSHARASLAPQGRPA